jgi:hypothetical protein
LAAIAPFWEAILRPRKHAFEKRCKYAALPKNLGVPPAEITAENGAPPRPSGKNVGRGGESPI